NTAEGLFLTNACQVYKCRVGDFEDTKASVIGEYLPAKLGMDEAEVPLYMVLTDDYKGFLLFLFATGKVARVPLASYETKQNRRKLIGAYSDKAPLVWQQMFTEEEEIAIQTSAGRLLLVGTAQIPQKTTRSTAGVNVITLKKGQRIQSVKKMVDLELKDPHRYRVRSLPAAGALLRTDDLAEQITL
ncbi:MAG: topoisomerase IV, partial [Oscillospiraceae bacterium]